MRAVWIALLSIGIASTVLPAKAQQDAAVSASSEGYILHPGEGEVLLMGAPVGGKVVVKVDPEKTGSPQMAMGIQYVEGEIPIHAHEHEEEFLFVHTGQGMATLGDRRVPVRAGTTIYLPPGVWHGFRNTAEEASRIMWVVTPGIGAATRLEHFFRAVGTPQGMDMKSLTPEQFAEIMKKHKMKTRAQ